MLEILKTLQQSIAALDNKVPRQHATPTEDVRMIRRNSRHGRTRVTEGEIVARHDEVKRMQPRFDEVATPIEILEGQRN